MKKELKYIDLPSWFYPKRISTWSLKWFAYFTILYIIPWFPTPFTYTEGIYIGPLGMPLFVWGWIVINLLAILGVFVFYQQANKVGFFDDDNIKNCGGGK